MKTIDQWLEEAGGRAYVDEEGWEECARHLERKMGIMRSCLSEAENELRCFGSFDGHIARWEQRIDGTANIPICVKTHSSAGHKKGIDAAAAACNA